MFLIGLFVGAILIGSPIGFATAAFCVAAKRGDEQIEEYQQQKIRSGRQG